MAAADLHSNTRPGELVARSLELSYGEPGNQKWIVSDCSFTIERGKLTALIGPSGCGKSSLVRLLAGFESPTAGTIELDGRPIRGPGRDRLVLFQESALFPWMTSYENIVYGPRARGELTQNTLEFAEVLLERVGLQAFRHKYPAQLSGGMQRRVELARALINDPKVMLLDEPFRGLDALTKELMWDYYASLLEDSGRTSVFVTTDIDEAVILADRILIMANIPTFVRAVIEVDLPRPRKPADLSGARANAIKSRALELLNEEALRSFRNRPAAGSGAAVA